MALLYAMAMAHRPSSCGGNVMGKKKNAPAEIEKVTITMSRPVAEAVAKACEMYLRLHMGQFEDLTDELCMAKFYAALETIRLPTKKNGMKSSISRLTAGTSCRKKWTSCTRDTSFPLRLITA